MHGTETGRVLCGRISNQLSPHYTWGLICTSHFYMRDNKLQLGVCIQVAWVCIHAPTRGQKVVPFLSPSQYSAVLLCTVSSLARRIASISHKTSHDHFVGRRVLRRMYNYL